MRVYTKVGHAINVNNIRCICLFGVLCIKLTHAAMSWLETCNIGQADDERTGCNNRLHHSIHISLLVYGSANQLYRTVVTQTNDQLNYWQ